MQTQGKDIFNGNTKIYEEIKHEWTANMWKKLAIERNICC